MSIAPQDHRVAGSRHSIEDADVTLVICTCDRPQFLFRALQHYEGAVDKVRQVLVADSSAHENWMHIASRYGQASENERIVIRHVAPGTSMTVRIHEMLKAVKTEFVFLVADDDVLFADWLPGGVELLRQRPECAVVFGHTLSFAVGDFSPRGEVIDVQVTAPNPPLHWLEDIDWAKRLHELELSDWTTAGWYALQRTSDLKLITHTAVRFGLAGYAFERFFIFAQAVLGTTVMMDKIYLARQVNRADIREPFSFRAEKVVLPALEAAAVDLLANTQKISEAEARKIVVRTLARELRQLRVNDRRRPLRVLKKRFSKISSYYLRCASWYSKHTKGDYGDSRFPSKPMPEAFEPYTRLLASIACQEDAGSDS